MPDDSAKLAGTAVRSQAFSRLAALFVMIIGAVVLVGWTFDLEKLKSIEGDITMKANAAICLMLVAASAWALTNRTASPYQVVGKICSWGAGLIGLLTLVEHISGWNFHIDQLLFTELPGALATTSPGRMGVTSSSCFILFSIALSLLYQRRSISVAQVLSTLAGFWSLLAVIGYTYQAEALFGVARYTGIAFPTAVALLLLSLSILAGCIDGGVFSVICSETAAGIMARRMVTVALLVPFAMGWLRLAGQRAGYFDLGFGTSLLVSAIILIFLLAIWRVAVKLQYADQQRALTGAMAQDERRAAERAQSRLAGIVESSHDAIISKTLDGIVDSWNAAAEKLFEYTAEEAIGQPITLIIPTERHDEERMIINKLRKGQGVDHFDTVRVSKTGKHIPISLTISPILNRQGQVIGASKIARDISDRRNAEAERERSLLQERALRADAERAARLKDEFLATISHELRTPLNAILGWSAILRRTPLEKAEADRGIEAIERNAKSQAQLIEDLLDVSRIVSGNLRLEVQTIALTTAVKEAMESIQLAADAKKIRMQIIVDPVADNVRGDVERLRQVIWNLLSNSIKFTPARGSVTVKIDRVDSMAQVTVSDTGEGISAEFLPFVFERFKQANGTTTRKHGGLGLGLAIARHLMEMHGGTMEAESPGLGLGAIFKIRLPLASVSEGPSAAPNATATLREEPIPVGSPALQGLRILAVDDEADARDMLRVALEGFGADVATASSVQDALDVLPTWKPDVLVSDIGMPERDGYALIKEIRDLPTEKGGGVPAIALTGYVRVEDRMRALTAGYQMFVQKPVQIGELATIIVALVGL